ncbi:hypothetical protein [Streptomyces sp. SudanB91_2054]|uniref:hypothetical protein n=1 Tax=Streptomyces sp. SudanB91_2054 TaxID=3035278 RepID=UPI0036DA6848
MPQLAFVHTFWTDYEQLDKPVRAAVRKAMAKFQSLTVAELYADKGLGLSVARMARDPRMRTMRITAFWRGVVLAPDDGSETFLLLKVLPHDEALQWAATRLASVNSAMGSLELRDVAAMERLVTSRPASHAPTTLFARFSATELTRLGIDGQTLEAIRTIADRAQFDAFQPLLPEDQGECSSTSRRGSILRRSSGTSSLPGNRLTPTRRLRRASRTPSPTRATGSPFSRKPGHWRSWLASRWSRRERESW